MNFSSNHRRALEGDLLSQVLAEFKGGSREAFRLLYDRFEYPIYRFCKHFTGDEATARDAFQETFIRMYEHRRELKTENIESWLFSIARRVSLNLIRQRRRTHEAFDELLHTNPTVPDPDHVLKDQLSKALSMLPVSLREAIILRDIEGHSYSDIALIVGIDLSLAKVRVYRARLMMRRILSPIVTERF